jgi:hypothetical protein
MRHAITVKTLTDKKVENKIIISLLTTLFSFETIAQQPSGVEIKIVVANQSQT